MSFRRSFIGICDRIRVVVGKVLVRVRRTIIGSEEKGYYRTIVRR